MATTLSTTLTSGIMWDFRHDTGTVASGLISVDSNRLSQTQRLANAACDLVWHDHATLAHAATREIDLAGVLMDSFGHTITFGHIVGLYIKNLNVDAAKNNFLTVGNGTHPFLDHLGAAAHTIKVRSSGCLLLWSPLHPYTVTAGTGDDLSLTATMADAAGDVTYDIVIVGTVA